MNYAKRILSLLPVLAMLLTLSPTVFAAYLPFTDVPAGSWYRDSVEYVWENELMSGTSNSTFSPDTNMTRAMLVTVLYRLDGSPEDFTISPFVDVPFEAYYYKPVVWAYKNGIVSGTGAHTFSPNANITREQLVAIFCRYANYKGSDTPATADLTGYVDYGRVSVYAREPFQWAVGCGIVSGTSIAILSPQGTATRAQCATIMHRFIQWTEAAVTPTLSPIPTIDPTLLPSMAPTLRPTLMPIPVPTSVPTQFPSPMDTPEPTSLPTLQPTPEPTPEPTPTPTPEPTPVPTVTPTESLLISDPQDYSAMAELPKIPVQDILYYTKHGVTVDGDPGDTYCKYDSLSDTAIEEYIAMLEENGFTLNNYFSESYSGGGSYRSWGLLYDLDPDIQTIDQTFTDLDCHICIYKSRSSYGTNSYRISWSPDLTMCDLGLRKDGTTVPITPQGESVEAGLWQMPDGSYQTTDGRLSVSPGSATVIRGGETLTGTVSFETTEKGQDVLTISGYADTEQVVFSADAGYVTQNAVYRTYELEEDEISLSVTIDGDAHTCTRNSVWYEFVSIRPMYYVEDGDAVYYIYIKTTGETPKELEILCAVNTAPPPEVPFPEVDESKLVKENGNSAKTITITTDQFLEIEYTNREWGSMYHTFEWTITAGEDILLMKDGYDSAVFAPLAAGEASVKLRYGYTKEEPDVLTGIMRDKAKSKTRTYTIIIEEPTQTE